MRQISAQEKVIIPIGRQGENGAAEIIFDVSGWADLYGNGAFELLNRRPAENTPYTCSITVSDEQVHWIVQSADVALVGHGRCELTYVVDDVIAKSVVFATCVLPSIEGAGEVPEPYESRIQDLIVASAGAVIAAKDSEAYAAGTRDGADVPSDDPAYHNNSKYYSSRANSSANTAQGYASDAGQSAGISSGSALKSEGYAVGTANGRAVASTSPYYHNNSKYYSEQASESATAAAGSATAADGSASAAAGSATAADESATAAAGSATAAAGSATAAAGSASAAAGSATAAAGSASDAAAKLALVTEEGTRQVGLVTAEGTTQKNAVIAKGQEVIESIPEDYSDLTSDVEDLKSSIGDVEKGYVVFGLVPDTYITGTGVEAYYAGWTSSDYIPTTDDTITVVATIRSTYNSFYDENKSFISGKNFTVEVGTTIIQVPSNAKYFRLSNTSAAMANEKVYSTVSVRLGSLESVIKNKDAEAKQNYYENQTLISGRVYDGVYSDAITTIHCTDYLPITPGRTYAIYGAYISASYAGYYDKNKTYKGSLPLDNLINTYPYDASFNCLIFTAPSDASYVRLNYLNSDLINGDTLRPEWYFRDITGKKLANKRVLVIGDSISTDVYGNYKKWVTNLLDSGVLSIGYTKNESQHATGYVATYASQADTTFIERLKAIGDLSGYDLIITFGGINDWIQSINFDVFKTAVDTYYSYLIENATQARIAVLTPLHTALYGTNNSAGKTQKDYDDYIKSVANEYAFPCLNLTDESGFCPDKSSTFSDMWTLVPSGFTDHDGVHPIAEWEKKYLAPQIEQFLMGIIS